MTLVWVFILGIFSVGLSPSVKTDSVKTQYTYYSDYYVFVADDRKKPLIIPIDFNWSPTQKGYTSEFKGWYGTQKDWPIAYYKKERQIAQENIPKESWEHTNGPYFQFNTDERKIIATIKGAPKVELIVPQSSEWVQLPDPEGIKKSYAFRTTAKVKGKERSGWMLYERIRWDKNTVANFGDFKAFYWIPLVVNGDFYHFEQHKGKQTAAKWTQTPAGIQVETVSSFSLAIVATTKDVQSGRTNIPKEIRLQVPKWELDIALKSKGGQVGHGEKFPKGLAYYRQSLLQSKSNSPSAGYGMLELILEND